MPLCPIDLRNVRVEQRDNNDIIHGDVLNAFGLWQDIWMERKYWDYLEFLVSEYGREEIRGWIKLCDTQRGELSFNDALRDWIYAEDCRRLREGEERPHWMKFFKTPPDEDLYPET